MIGEPVLQEPMMIVYVVFVVLPLLQILVIALN